MAFEIRYKANESKAAGLKFACLHNLSSSDALSRSECTLSKRIVSVEVPDQRLLWGNDFQSPPSRAAVRAMPELPEINVNSNSKSIWFGPRCCEWWRASLSAHNCQQHERLLLIHVELYGLIHERILLLAWYLWTEEGKSFSFLRIHHAPHTNEKFRVRFSSSLFCSNGNAIEAFKGFAPFWMEAGRQEGREREHDDDCGVEDGARKTRFRKIFMRSKEEKILQPHRKAYDKQFRYTNTGQGRRRGAIREAKLRTYLGRIPFKLINNESSLSVKTFSILKLKLFNGAVVEQPLLSHETFIVSQNMSIRVAKLPIPTQSKDRSSCCLTSTT